MAKIYFLAIFIFGKIRIMNIGRIVAVLLTLVIAVYMLKLLMHIGFGIIIFIAGLYLGWTARNMFGGLGGGRRS
jgi:hypothetical protein